MLGQKNQHLATKKNPGGARGHESNSIAWPSPSSHFLLLWYHINITTGTSTCSGNRSLNFNCQVEKTDYFKKIITKQPRRKLFYTAKLHYLSDYKSPFKPFQAKLSDQAVFKTSIPVSSIPLIKERKTKTFFVCLLRHIKKFLPLQFTQVLEANSLKN